MALAYQQLYDAIVSMRTNNRILTDKASMENYSSILRPFILFAQEEAVNVEPVATAFLVNPANRRFLYNPTLTNQTIRYNGQDRLFVATGSYCMHPDEWTFFKDVSDRLGYGFVDDPDGNLYLGGSFAFEFYAF
jgi:hypothetical protein